MNETEAQSRMDAAIPELEKVIEIARGDASNAVDAGRLLETVAVSLHKVINRLKYGVEQPQIVIRTNLDLDTDAENGEG